MAMKAGKKPFGGVYYSIPMSDGSWNLLIFADAFYEGQANRSRIWNEVVSILACRWSKDELKLQEQLKECLHGLPGGRVVCHSEQYWKIVHGNDSPQATSIEFIIEAFDFGQFQLMMRLDNKGNLKSMTIKRWILVKTETHAYVNVATTGL